MTVAVHPEKPHLAGPSRALGTVIYDLAVYHGRAADVYERG